MACASPRKGRPVGRTRAGLGEREQLVPDGLSRAEVAASDHLSSSMLDSITDQSASCRSAWFSCGTTSDRYTLLAPRVCRARVGVRWISTPRTAGRSEAG